MELSQMLYMAETEGLDDLVSTRTAKLNAVVNEINSQFQNATLDASYVAGLMTEHGVDNITMEDFDYVASRI